MYVQLSKIKKHIIGFQLNRSCVETHTLQKKLENNYLKLCASFQNNAKLSVLIKQMDRI